MASEQTQTLSTANTALDDRVVGEIGSLRAELAEIRQLLYRGHSLERALEEYSYLPPGRRAFRWGFMGVWRGGRSSCHSILTTDNEDELFDDPKARPEHIAALAAGLSNSHTVAICLHLWRHGSAIGEKGACTPEELQTACGLSADELAAAVAPLLEWRFVRWHEGALTASGPGMNGQGLNYVVTLAMIAQQAVAERDRQPRT